MSIQRTISGNEIYQIKVTLLRTVPPIWRRLLVPSNLTMSGLHYLLQLAMGWKDCHSHDFQLGGRSYGAIHLVQGGPDNLNESKVRLHQVLPPHSRKGRLHVRFRRLLEACRSPREVLAGRPQHVVPGVHGRRGRLPT